MGNQQGHNCFTPRTAKSTYHSEIIQKKKTRMNGNQKDPKGYLKFPGKVKSQSPPVCSSIQNSDGSITIKIQINMKGTSQSQSIFNRNPLKMEVHKPFQQNYANPAKNKIENILKQSLETMAQENAVNILELDLPETTTRRGSCQIQAQQY